MECVPNGWLYSFLRTERSLQLSWAERTRLALECVRAKHDLHLYPAPTKSSNFLLNSGFGIKMADFGSPACSRRSAPSARAAQRPWLAAVSRAGEETPSQDREAYTAASDVVLLGVVLWELCTNREPSQDEDKSMIPSWLLLRASGSTSQLACLTAEGSGSASAGSTAPLIVRAAQLLDLFASQLPEQNSSTASSSSTGAKSSIVQANASESRDGVATV